MRLMVALALLLGLPGCLATFGGAALGDALDDRRVGRPEAVPLDAAARLPVSTPLVLHLRDGRQLETYAGLLRVAGDSLDLGAARVPVADVLRVLRPAPAARTYMYRLGLVGFLADALSMSWSCPLGAVCWVLPRRSKLLFF